MASKTITHENAAPRFWAKVNKTDSCWLWAAALFERGYGAFRFKGRQVKAHRFSYELHFEPIPEGLYVCHKCDTPACVNPSHLFLGTHKDNAQDRQRKNRGRKQDGERNSRAKLTADKVSEIRTMYQHGHGQKEIAVLFGVSQTCISQIVLRKHWLHVVKSPAL